MEAKFVVEVALEPAPADEVPESSQEAKCLVVWRQSGHA
jgi:hypothetical protein